MLYLPNENLIKFSQNKSKTFLRRRSNGKLNSENREQKPVKPPLFLARCGPPYNTPMPRPTPCITPNRSFDGSRTFAHQLCCKLTIGYNAAPHIRPQS